MKKFVYFFLLILSIHAGAQTAGNSSPLKQFLGKYQSADNRMTMLLIQEKDQHLVLKQLWDNQEIAFTQTDALRFRNEERNFPLEFKKDSKGQIVQVVAFDRDIWNKVADNYQPQLLKTISLTAEQLKPLEGQYHASGEGDNNASLQITASGGGLILKQSWDNKEVKLFAISNLEFFNNTQTFPIKFVKDKDGNVTQLIAFNRDIWIKGR